jgi:Flp pilus assembly protein TadD
MTMRHKGKLMVLGLTLALAGCASAPEKTPPEATAKTEGKQKAERIIAWNDETRGLFREANRLRSNNLEQAAVLYKRCAMAEGAPEPCWFNLFKARMALGDSPEALGELEKQARERGAASARLENLWGSVLVSQGNFTGARTVFETIRAAQPDYALAARNLGIVLDMYLGDLQGALEQYTAYRALLQQQGRQDPQLDNWLADLNNRLKRAAQ